MPETAPNSPATGTSWQLPHTPRSALHARELLRTQLTAWQIDGEVAETAELLLSELFTNSLRHASAPPGREIGVRFTTYDGLLRVEVSDANNCRPTPRQTSPDDEGGRGLTLVQALAERWGCCPRRHGIGKATWAELALPRSVRRPAVLPEPPLTTPEVAHGQDPAPDGVTVTVTFTGDRAEVLRTLAHLEGRTPEQVALDRIAHAVPFTDLVP